MRRSGKWKRNDGRSADAVDRALTRTAFCFFRFDDFAHGLLLSFLSILVDRDEVERLRKRFSKLDKVWLLASLRSPASLPPTAIILL